jgi:hypothetical protein
MVFDYQLELLRSNPGSTVVVKLDTDEPQPTFMRFYVCFDACKKGFFAGCRKVIGLDGYFFKGLTNGELLCALGKRCQEPNVPNSLGSCRERDQSIMGLFLIFTKH